MCSVIAITATPSLSFYLYLVMWCSVIAITTTPPSLPLLLSVSSYVFDHRYHYNSLPLLAINLSMYILLVNTGNQTCLPGGAPFCAPGSPFLRYPSCFETKGHLFVPWGQLFVLLICYTYYTKSTSQIYLFCLLKKCSKITNLVM